MKLHFGLEIGSPQSLAEAMLPVEFVSYSS